MYALNSLHPMAVEGSLSLGILHRVHGDDAEESSCESPTSTVG